MVWLIFICDHYLQTPTGLPRHRFAHTSANLADLQSPYMMIINVIEVSGPPDQVNVSSRIIVCRNG